MPYIYELWSMHCRKCTFNRRHARIRTYVRNCVARVLFLESKKISSMSCSMFWYVSYMNVELNMQDIFNNM